MEYLLAAGSVAKEREISPNSIWLVTSLHVSARRVETMHFGCVELVRLDTLVSTRSTRPTCRALSRRDVKCQAKCNLGHMRPLSTLWVWDMKEPILAVGIFAL